MATEPRTVSVPYPVQPPRNQFAPGSGSPLLQGSGMADTRVTIRMRPGAGIGVEYLGESVKLSLDASTLGEMPPATGDGTYYTIVYDPETGMTWRVEASAGGALPFHTHVEADVENLVQDLAIRPVDAPSDGGVYSRQNGMWVVVGGVVGWDDIVGVPDTFPPSAHTHPISEVEQLPETLFDINSTLQTLYDIKIEDAPLDGEQYVRQSGDWAPVDIPPPFDGYTKTQSDARYVNVLGDSMTGALQVPLGSQTAVSLHFGNTQTGLFGSSSQVNISVSGSARMTFASTAIIANLPLRAVAGTAALPAYSFNSFNNMGLYATSATELDFSVGGARKLKMETAGITADVPIILPGNPTAALEAAPKQYVDATIGAGGNVGGSGSALQIAIWGTQKSLAGTEAFKLIDGTLTSEGGASFGQAVVLPANPTAALQAAPKQYVDLRELASNKGAVNGYAPLDGSAKVPAINLPAYVDDVLEYANLAAFPATGTVGVIYIALDTNKTYRWGGSSYTEISPSPGSTDAVPEGSTNKYYTDERVDDRVSVLIRPGTGITWAYDDTAGTLTPTVTVSGGGSAISVSDTAPGSPAANSLWWESDSGGLFLYYNDGNTSQYVQVNGSSDAYNPIRLNPQVINVNQTIPTGYNGMTAGPITIASGVTVDVASGSVWTIV